jgi:hypothetical protein
MGFESRPGFVAASPSGPAESVGRVVDESDDEGAGTSGLAIARTEVVSWM